MSHTNRRLGVEKLEDRTVPTQFGNPWPHADRLTVSFAPDGTDVAGETSRLSSALSGVGSSSVWQAEIARALQTWAAATNVNFVVVSDNGQKFGTPGPVQGSAGVGDIRIAARPLSDDVIAVATPFDMFNSWAGEIVLNSNKLFGRGGADGKYDLYTVALQETGHALGLANSGDAASVMFTNYTTPHTALASSDLVAVQRLYGVRSADRFDAGGANDTLDKAADITFVKDGADLKGTDGTDGDKPLVAAGDLSTLADVDTYVFKNPRGSSDFYVSALTDGLGQLKAKVSVYDKDGKQVAFKNERTGQTLTSAAVTGTRSEPFLIKVENAKSDSNYRVVIEGATEDVYGVGAYKLAAGKEPHEAMQFTAPAGSYLNVDGGTNEARDKATALGDVSVTADARWDFVTTGSVFNGTATDVDWYKVHTKKNTPKTAVFMVSAEDPNALRPSIEVYNKDGVRQQVEVLSSGGGTVVVQMLNAAADTDYFVRVAAASPTALKTGNYTLAIDFRDVALSHQTFAAGTLQGDVNQVLTSFDLTRTQSVWFELSGTADPNVASRLTVYDANGVAVFTLGSKGGQVVGGDVFLQPGAYTVRIVAAAKTGPLPAFDFRARYSLGSDPIGIAPLTQPPPVGSPTPAPTQSIRSLTYVNTATNTITTTSPVYSSPVGVAPAPSPLVWVPVAPTNLYVASLNDIYANPWGW